VTNIICILCERTLRKSEVYYAAQFKNCGPWVGGCLRCYDNKEHAKNAVRAHGKLEGGCGAKGCDECERRYLVRDLIDQVMDDWNEDRGVN
jgi:hypothetical protein